MAAGLAVVAAITLILAVVVALTLQYAYGIKRDPIAVGQIDLAARAADQLFARGELLGSADRSGLEHFVHARTDSAVLGWLALGAALVLGNAAARLRWVGWPIHPLLFVIWGTYPSFRIAGSFIIAGLVRYAVVSVGGVKGYTLAKPLMIGLIAGEIAMIAIWVIVGATYFTQTGLRPPTIHFLP